MQKNYKLELLQDKKWRKIHITIYKRYFWFFHSDFIPIIRHYSVMGIGAKWELPKYKVRNFISEMLKNCVISPAEFINRNTKYKFQIYDIERKLIIGDITIDSHNFVEFRRLENGNVIPVKSIKEYINMSNKIQLVCIKNERLK